MHQKSYIKKLLPNRPKASHKGSFGHVLNIAGSEFYSGAAYFSSVSALKVGCGLITLASDDTVLKSVASLTPDVIFKNSYKLKSEDFSKFQAVSIGCGLSQSKKAKNIFKKTIKNLKNSQTPFVIDADGLNILAEFTHPKKNWVKETNISLPQNTILTPHPKEMSRLLNVPVEQILETPEYWVKKCSETFSCTTILKLHNTLIADIKGDFYANNTGNTSLSHGGSGDVLCGMITGFLAQGLRCFEASVLSVYLHGLAAEIASDELSEYSVLASDLINYIPNAIKRIL